METVRNLISKYYSDVSEYIFLYDSWKTTSDIDEDTKKERQKTYKEFTELMSDVRNDYYNITLFVSNNNSNSKVLKNVNLLWNELSYIVKYYDIQIQEGKISLNNVNKKSDMEITIDNYISKLINNGVKDASEYFKIEWERAKRGE